MIRLIRRLLASLLVVLGLAVILASGFALFGSDELQQLYVPTLPSSDYGAGLSKGEGEITVQKGSPIGIIEIPRLGLSSVVLEGDDTAALLFGVGHLSDTPLPWHGGNSVFAAHRDTFFAPLRDIRAGDDIVVTTATAVHRYAVVRTRIVDPSDVSVLRPSAGRTLTLVTCYPFDFVGSAPKRFVVVAEAR